MAGDGRSAQRDALLRAQDSELSAPMAGRPRWARRREGSPILYAASVEHSGASTGAASVGAARVPGGIHVTCEFLAERDLHAENQSAEI